MATERKSRAFGVQDLSYPVILIEAPGNELTGIKVVWSRGGFFTFSRLPRVRKFANGRVFASDGLVWNYAGLRGAVALPSWIATILEALIVPALVFQIWNLIAFVGPDLSSRQRVGLEAFKNGLLQDAAPHTTKPQLKRLRAWLDPCTSESDAVLAFDNWVFGQRLPIPVKPVE